MGFYDFKVKDAFGEEVNLSDYKGKTVLVVNVASKCGFTPQYEGLQKLYSELKDKNFVILGFPCNQFKGQEPGTNEEIQTFCKLDYGVEFPVFGKIDVNGKDEDPIYTFLKKEKPDVDDNKGEGKAYTNDQLAELSERKNPEDIVWNFEKFLIDKDGNVVKRYSPSTTPEEIKPEIEKIL